MDEPTLTAAYGGLTSERVRGASDALKAAAALVTRLPCALCALVGSDHPGDHAKREHDVYLALSMLTEAIGIDDAYPDPAARPAACPHVGHGPGTLAHECILPAGHAGAHAWV